MARWVLGKARISVLLLGIRCDGVPFWHRPAVPCKRKPCVLLLDTCNVVEDYIRARKLWYRLTVRQYKSINLAIVYYFVTLSNIDDHQSRYLSYIFSTKAYNININIIFSFQGSL